MRVLFLIDNLDSASGICVQAVTRTLTQKGHSVTILTQVNEKSTGQATDEINASIVTIRGDFLTHLSNKAYSVDKKVSGIIAKIISNINRFRIILMYPTWPMKSIIYPIKLFGAADNIVKKEKIDVIVPIYNTIESLIAGSKVKRENVQVLYVPYFLDALLGGQTPRLMKENTKQRKALAWEKKLLNSADGIVMMSAAKSSYEKMGIFPDYLAKTKFLDLPLLIHHGGKNYSIHRNYFPEDEVVFLFAGSMPRNIRNPEFFLELFSGIEKQNWHLYLVGNSDFDDLISKLIKKCSRIHRLGSASHSQVSAMLEEADVLVNIGNDLAHMVPSKIFEYMSFCKPILSTYKIKEDPCIPYLALYNRALVIDEKECMSKSADAMKNFIEHMCDTRHVEFPIDFMESLCERDGPLFNNTPDAFVECLEELYAYRCHDIGEEI